MKYLLLLLFPFFCIGQNAETLLKPGDIITHPVDSSMVVPGRFYPLGHVKTAITYDTIPCQILCGRGDSVFILRGFSINRIDWLSAALFGGHSDKFSTAIKYLDSNMKEIDNHIIWMSKND